MPCSPIIVMYKKAGITFAPYYRHVQNSAGAGSNYNHQFLYILAIAFNATRIYYERKRYKVSRDIYLTKFDEVRGKLRRDLEDLVSCRVLHMPMSGLACPDSESRSGFQECDLIG